MNIKNQKRLFIGIFIVAILYGIYRNTYKNNVLENNGVETTCIVTEYKFIYKASYRISFEFIVNGEVFIGSAKVSSFKCDNGVKGCVGESFKVVYDKDNPEINEIDLGKYNKYKKLGPSF